MPEGDMMKILRENLELARENNRLLKKIRRASILGGLLKIVWWALILGVPIYFYFTFVGPYLESVSQTLGDIKNVGEGIPTTFPELLQKFGI